MSRRFVKDYSLVLFLIFLMRAVAGPRSIWAQTAVAPSVPGEFRDRVDQLGNEGRELRQASEPTTEPSESRTDLTQVGPENSPGPIPATLMRESLEPSRVFGTTDCPTVRLTGFFQADVGWVVQDTSNKTAVGDAQDGADFRRTRLAAIGKVWDNVGYSLEVDFSASGRPSFMDVWVELSDLEQLGNLRFGQFRHPIGMEGQTSVRELTFLERALPFAFIPFRQIGLMAHDTMLDDTATWAVSTFRFPTDAFGGNVGDSGGLAMATRWTWLPIDQQDSGRLVHLGVAYSLGDPANNRVRYRNQPEFFVSETGGADLVPGGVPSRIPPFVDTGAIPTDIFQLFGVEAATAIGALYVQSELIYAVVDRMAASTATFPGAYVYAGYFLTGERRSYNHKNGVFGRVRPQDPFSRCQGSGAWELAGRWSFLDLNDADIRGGRLNDLTLGLNWYLNRFTKFQFNYIHAFLASPVNGHNDADILALRAQVDF